ncbi:PhoD-like phosphatase N-terminal domain-containing protein [Parasphingorhabdus pacifica]
MFDPSFRSVARRSPVSRRSVLLGGTAAGAVALSAAGALPVTALPGAGAARRGAVFSLGVASGDPAPDGMVLWTRLAADPLAEDGMGGMPNKALPVEWQVAEDERFTRIVQSGTAQAAPELGHSVHVELTGLRPGREYFYRFRAEGELPPWGAPARHRCRAR